MSDTNNIQNQFAKLSNGTIWHINTDRLKHNKVQLRNKNKTLLYRFSEFKKLNATQPTKAEILAFLETEKVYINEISQKLVKRAILAQLLIELDDELQSEYSDNKNFADKLRKSNQEAERLISKQYDAIYNNNPTIVTNLLNQVDVFVNKCSKLNTEDFMHINTVLDDYINNPEKHKTDKVTLTKLKE